MAAHAQGWQSQTDVSVIPVPGRQDPTSPMYTGSSDCVSLSRSSTMWPYFSVALTLQQGAKEEPCCAGAGQGAGGERAAALTERARPPSPAP